MLLWQLSVITYKQIELLQIKIGSNLRYLIKYTSSVITAITFLNVSGCSKRPSIQVTPPSWSQKYILALQNPKLLKSSPEFYELTTIISNYAPRIWWHSEEKFGPSDPLQFLAKSTVWIHHLWRQNEKVNHGELKALNLIKNVTSEDYYLESDESTAREVNIHAPIFWKFGSERLMNQVNSKSVPNSHVRIVLEYWYHSSFNETGLFQIGNHQGDWEGLAHIIDLSLTSEGKLKHHLVMTFLASHESGQWFCPQELEYHEGHPVVFSAKGTHATYRKEGDQKSTFLIDKTQRGIAWDSWHQIRPLALEPYFEFLGSWGKKTFIPFMSGPKVPGPLKSFPKTPMPLNTNCLL